ncbi:MAG: prepilin-type N-terminal cleavage/methylation domain-containing protein [Rhodospirillaceae bacterium]|nr:MAG: prepilin-type N-terminal cleavage/methylation domain-containing protein [Rhodospirillaceae bacterium]
MKAGGSQKGFTLIEMSIVLVIIGLIIGGILKGQEIINASRQKNLVTQIDGIRSAINTFNDKYGALPGSFSAATTRLNAKAVNGTGTGFVGANNTSSATIVAQTAVGAGNAAGSNGAQTDEPAIFWCQLAFADLIGNSSSDCAQVPTVFGNGSYLPASAYSGTGLSVAYGTSDTTTSGQPIDSLWLRVHRTAGVPTAGVSGKTMAAIDAKYDDGQPGTGQIRTGTNTADCPNTTTVAPYTPVSATSDQPTCIMFANLVQ